ncbi:MAG: hypothetical protein LBS26_01175 [Campylobacteraceae bacterium]|nr:hypothetical protein [Campylobacteraceae bacterium]
MKKIYLGKLLVAIGLVGACAPIALADENSGVFIGGEFGYVRSAIDFETTFNGLFGLYSHSVSLKSNDSTLSGGIKIGYIFSPNHRAYFAYNNGGKREHEVHESSVYIKGEQQTKTVVVGYSFTPQISENKRFLLDIHAGSAKTHAVETITSGFTTIKEDIPFSGTVVGVRLGTIYSINKNMELEFTVKIDGLSYDEAAFKNSSTTKAKQDQTDVGFFIGANYKF